MQKTANIRCLCFGRHTAFKAFNGGYLPRTYFKNKMTRKEKFSDHVIELWDMHLRE